MATTMEIVCNQLSAQSFNAHRPLRGKITILHKGNSYRSHCDSLLTRLARLTHRPLQYARWFIRWRNFFTGFCNLGSFSGERVTFRGVYRHRMGRVVGCMCVCVFVCVCLCENKFCQLHISTPHSTVLNWNLNSNYLSRDKSNKRIKIQSTKRNKANEG